MMSNPHRHGHVRFYIPGIPLLPWQRKKKNLQSRRARSMRRSRIKFSRMTHEEKTRR